MEYRKIDGHSQYEINKFGEVRKIKTRKLMCSMDGKIKLVNDSGSRTTRSIEKLVQESFFPELGNQRNVIRFIEGVGYVVDKNGYNTDDSLIAKLVSYDCDYKIRARKNYKDEIRFEFMGLLNEDKGVKCLLFNEDNETTRLFNCDEEAQVEKQMGDELYYFYVYEGKEGMNNVDLLEHILNAKFFYIKSKLDDYDMDVDEAKLYKKYLAYDFEERYDKWAEELQIQKLEKEVKRKVKVVDKGVPFLDQMPQEDKEEYEKEKKIELAKKHERLRIMEQRRLQDEERQKQTLMLEGELMVRAVEAQSKQALRRYNKVFGTNFNDIDAFVRQYKNERRIKEQRQAAAMRQKYKDEKMKQKLQQKLKELD